MFAYTNIIYNEDMDKAIPALKMIDIFKRNSDFNHVLKEKDIKELLAKEGIIINDRKVIYSLINSLNNNGYRIIYDASKKGYYLDASPFSKGEIKILSDSISNNKELDTDEINNKLLSFISSYESKLINDNKIVIKREKSSQTLKKPGYFYSYSLKIEKILDAINNHLKLEIFHNSKLRIIDPYFLYFSNNKYYIHDSKMFSYRVDRINYLRIINEEYEYKEEIKNQIIRKIKTSFDNFDKNESCLISLKSNNLEEIKNRLYDDFPNLIIDNNKNIVVEYKPNEIFYAKIVSYNGQIIVDKPDNVKDDFRKYLLDILKDY